ncbi:unnamed protein product [Periconia digitata]|uniref:Uncharacterized protein n=1 Tax=Periconia digitata TaxID=1303443 RepID=A0A9W4US72_9PLEO|nr:unnamed protein product [Periconia digitata]
MTTNARARALKPSRIPGATIATCSQSLFCLIANPTCSNYRRHHSYNEVLVDWKKRRLRACISDFVFFF